MLDEYNALLTVQELTETLNIGRNTAYELLNSGEISAFRIGRNWKIPKDSVIAYIGRCIMVPLSRPLPEKNA